MSSLDYGIPNRYQHFPSVETTRTSNLDVPNGGGFTDLQFQPPAPMDTDQIVKNPDGTRLRIPKSGLWLTHLASEWGISQFNGYRDAVIWHLRSNYDPISRSVLTGDIRGPLTSLAPLGQTMLSVDPMLVGDEVFGRFKQENGGAASQLILAANANSPRLVAYCLSETDRWIGACLYAKTAQTIGTGAVTQVNLTTIDFIRGINWGNPSVTAQRNSIPIAVHGVYLVVGQVIWERNDAFTQRALTILRTSPSGFVQRIVAERNFRGDGTAVFEQVSGLVVGSPGDRISMEVEQDSGGDLNLEISTDSRMPNLRVIKLSDYDPSRYGLAEGRTSFVQAYSSVTRGGPSTIIYDRVLHDTDNIAGDAPRGFFRIRRRGIYLISANMEITYAAVATRPSLEIYRGDGTEATTGQLIMIARSSGMAPSVGDLRINACRVIELFPRDQISIFYTGDRTINAATEANLYKDSVSIIRLDDPSTQGSGRYFEAGA